MHWICIILDNLTKRYKTFLKKIWSIMSSGIRLIFSLLVTITLTALLSVSGNVEGVENSTWTLGEEMPTNRTEITASVIGDKIYVIGGADYNSDGAVNIVEIYDPNTDQWTNGAPLPYPLDHAPSVAHNGKIYVIGGFLEDKVPTNKLWIYDSTSDTWTEGAPLSASRAALVAEIINGTIYAIGGVNATHHPVTTNEAYNIENNSWSFREPLSKPKHHAASAVIGDSMYVLGGRLLGNGEPSEINESLTNMDDNSRYDPQSDTWVELEPMPIRRSGFAAESFDGKIYVFGGQMADGANKNIEKYDPGTNQWTTEPDMQVDRSGLAVAAYRDNLYVFGGQHKGLQALNVNEILTPSKDNNTNRNQA